MRKPLAVILLTMLAATGLWAQVPVDTGAQYLFGSSPGGTSEQVVIKAIDSANSTIEAMIYELTDPAIVKAFIRAQQRGVKVRMVADSKAAGEKYSLVARIRDAGIPVRLDADFSIFHHKALCVDRTGVELGSFNWTTNAVKHNAEDDLWLIGVPSLAAQVEAVWQNCWDESR